MPARHRTELSCWVRAWFRGPVGSMGPCGDRGEVDGRWMEMMARGGGYSLARRLGEAGAAHIAGLLVPLANRGVKVEGGVLIH